MSDITLRFMHKYANKCFDIKSLDELANWFRGIEVKPDDIEKMRAMRWVISDGLEWFPVKTNIYNSAYENLEILVSTWISISDSIKENSFACSDELENETTENQCDD